MKKYIYTALVLVPVIGIIAFYFWPSTKIEYVSQEVIKEVTIDPLKGQYEQREKELEAKYREIQSIEARLDVNRAEIERLTAENKDLTAKLANFMIGTASVR